MSVVTHEDLDHWVAGYECAWRTPGTEGLRELFTEDATYQTAPFEEPHRGEAAIAALWESERERPDEVFALEREIVAVEGDTGLVRAEVRYGDPVSRTYRDLWIVKLDKRGRCVAFEEWPFWPSEAEGSFSPGPRS